MVPQIEQIIPLFQIGVAVRSRLFKFCRVSHADKVTSDQPPKASAIRHNVAPQIRRRRIAVLKHDGFANTLVNVRHARALGHREFFLAVWRG